MTQPFRTSCVVSLTALLSIASASLQGTQPVPQQPTPRATPARDVGPAKPETAAIKGRVVSADGKPLRRTQVRVSAPELRDARTISTDTDGYYEVTALPPGRYTVRFSRSGYLTLSFGQRYPREAGKQVVVAVGETVSGIDAALPRAGVIAGRITDEIGDPVAGANVYAMQSTYFRGRRRVVPAGTVARTDDTGMFRLIGLPPGQFFVMGQLRESWVVSTNKEKMVMAFAPTYFPGTSSLNTAQQMKVGIGTELTGVDFSMAIGRAAKVGGVALSSSGGPLAGASISLSQEFMGPEGGSSMSAGSTTAGADGTWRLIDVAPGDYRIRASGTNGPSRENIVQTITVDGSDLEGVVLATGVGGQITGLVVAETDGARSVPLTRLRIMIRSEENRPVLAASSDGTVDPQGNFQVEGSVGPQRLAVSGMPDGWALKSIEREGNDLTDIEFELASGQRLDGVRVTITDRLSIVRGTISDDQNQPTSSGTVVIFADESRRWGDQSRFVRGVRPSQNGEFEVKGLPPATYRAIALDYIPEGDWNDPEVLTALRDRAARFILGEAEAKAIDLTLTK